MDRRTTHGSLSTLSDRKRGSLPVPVISSVYGPPFSYIVRILRLLGTSPGLSSILRAYV